MHPDGDPEVAGEFASESENESETEDVGDDDAGVLDVKDGPEKGSEEKGTEEAEAGGSPAAPEDATEHEFFDEGCAYGDA